MRAVYMFTLFLGINLHANCQNGQPKDTTITLDGKTRVQLLASPETFWEHVPDSKCISFTYPSPDVIVLTSKCDEAQKVTLKRQWEASLEDNSLLDVERPKKE